MNTEHQPVVTPELKAAVADLLEWYDTKGNEYTYRTFHDAITRLQHLELPSGQIGADIALFTNPSYDTTKVEYTNALNRLRYLTRPGPTIVPTITNPQLPLDN